MDDIHNVAAIVVPRRLMGQQANTVWFNHCQRDIDKPSDFVLVYRLCLLTNETSVCQTVDIV